MLRKGVKLNLNRILNVMRIPYFYAMTQKKVLTKEQFQQKMAELTEQEAERTGESRTVIARKILFNYQQRKSLIEK